MAKPSVGPAAVGPGIKLTLGATFPTYSMWATDPSGRDTSIAWVFGAAATAVPARTAAVAAIANRGSFLTKTSPAVCDL